MIFDEIYGCYYDTVSAILKESRTRKVSLSLIRKIAQEHMSIEGAREFEACLINSGDWCLMTPDMKFPVKDASYQPMTKLERRWLKTLLLDPRIELFDVDKRGLEDVDPLWRPEDICVYDASGESDPWQDSAYIERFQFLKQAIAEERSINVKWMESDGSCLSVIGYPLQLKYSIDAQRFELIVSVNDYRINIALKNITLCTYEVFDESCELDEAVLRKCIKKDCYKMVEFEVTDKRKAYERVSREFSIFYKLEAYQIGKDRFSMRIRYNEQQEDDLIMRLLAFGPKIQVLSPSELIERIKRVIQQQSQLWQ